MGGMPEGVELAESLSSPHMVSRVRCGSGQGRML